MSIRSAHEVSWNPPPRCPVCDVGVTASGRHQPIAVDEKGRPYCHLHGHMIEPDYDRLLAEYQRMREARTELLKDAEKHGVIPTEEEIEQVRREWQQA